MAGPKKGPQPPSSEASTASGPQQKRQLIDLLHEHSCGTFDIPLKSIVCTALVRPVNSGGVERLKSSIQMKGWLPNHPPAMVLDRDLVAEDRPCNDTFDRVRVRILDGNHRVTALRALFGEDYRVTCNVYWAFDPEIARVISDSEYRILQRTKKW